MNYRLPHKRECEDNARASSLCELPSSIWKVGIGQRLAVINHVCRVFLRKGLH
jgi:hypothetical protein